MRTYDFAPLWRSSVGFDRVFDQINNTQLLDEDEAYPPCDIVRTGEENFRVTLAVAGFSSNDLNITAQQNMLTVAGAKTNQASSSEQEYLHQGIHARPFERRFSLADHVEVERASLENGLLQIDLVRKIPDAMKPRRVEISNLGKGRDGDKGKEQMRVVS